MEASLQLGGLVVGLGRVLQVSLFGESHGCCVGALIEGVPPGLRVSEEELAEELARRRPGGPLVSPRREPDRPRILSGVYRGYTTGAPILVLVENRDVDSRFYEEIVKHHPRPGHADLGMRAWSMGFDDYRGGGFRSGRTTVGLVAAGYFAKKILGLHGVSVVAFLRSLGGVECSVGGDPIEHSRVYESPVRCPNPESAEKMMELLSRVAAEGDSVGGVVEARAYGVPPGLGQPPFEGLDASIAAALMAVPGVKAVEIGDGVHAARMRGSELGERIIVEEGRVTEAPGIAGGFATGTPLVVRAYFRPTATTRRAKQTIDTRTLEPAVIEGRGRHDPAIAVRGVPVVEAVLAIVLADQLLRRHAYTLMHYYWLEHGTTTPS